MCILKTLNAISLEPNNPCQENMDIICDPGVYELSKRSFLCSLEYINICLRGKSECLDIDIVIEVSEEELTTNLNNRVASFPEISFNFFKVFDFNHENFPNTSINIRSKTPNLTLYGPPITIITPLQLSISDIQLVFDVNLENYPENFLQAQGISRITLSNTIILRKQLNQPTTYYFLVIFHY